MSYVVANGIKLHVQRLGEGDRTVVFLHGLVMDNLSSWYYTVANAVARTSKVLLYDLRGHGLSEQPASGYTVDDNVADLVALLDAEGIQGPVYLAGNSFGGLIGLEFAQRYPERVAGLMMVEAHFPVPGWSEGVVATLEVAGVWIDEPRVLEWRKVHDKRHHRRRFAAAENFIMKTTLLSDLKAVPPYTAEHLGRIQCPTLALYGDESDVFERGRDLERWIPNCELRVFKDSAHSILMDNSREVRDHIVEWLDKQPLPRRGG